MVGERPSIIRKGIKVISMIFGFISTLCLINSPSINARSNPGWPVIKEFVQKLDGFSSMSFPEANVLHLRLQARFGGLNVPEEQMFYWPVDIALDQEGRIYVLDARDCNIKIFKSNGNFIRTIAQGGSGPGELNRPWIMRLIKDKIYIADTGNRRIQVLDLDGKYLKSYRLPLEFGFGMDFDSSGNLYLNSQGFREDRLISVYDNRGRSVRKFGDLEGKSFQYYDFALIKRKIRKGSLPDSFKNDVLLVTDSRDHVFAVHRALRKIRIYSTSGKLLETVEIRAEEYQKVYREFLRKNKEIENRPAAFYPLYYVNDLAVDGEGNLFILLNEPSQMIIYVYSDQGEFKEKF